MIEIYDQKRLTECGHGAAYLADHIKRTTKVNNPYRVYIYIKDYLRRNPCDDEVTAFLAAYLRDWRNLLKTHVVTDGSYTKCCILVRPDGILVTGDGGYHETYGWEYAWRDVLPYFQQKAQRIFLNMTDETWEEQRHEDEMWDLAWPDDEEWPR